MKDKQQEKPSALKREHPAHEFFSFFLFLCVNLPSWIQKRICIQNEDPDPADPKSMRTATLESIMLPELFKLKNPLALSQA
jgi:hypothetical protein